MPIIPTTQRSGMRAPARRSCGRGGFLVFNDFAHIDPDVGRYGVHRAVVDFVLETRWPLALFAFHPYALYDVALQKPADTSSA